MTYLMTWISTWTDTHLSKLYLPQISFAGGNDSQNLESYEQGTLYCIAVLTQYYTCIIISSSPLCFRCFWLTLSRYKFAY